MDIFKYAKENNADYYDSTTGYIYKVQNYNHAKQLGLPTEGIEVYDLDGDCLGLVTDAKGDN